MRKATHCKKGHTFYKSSNCPVCPICAKNSKAKEGFLSALSSPAQRALLRIGIKTLKQLSNYSESEILKLHGVGPSSIPKLKSALKKQNLSLRS